MAAGKLDLDHRAGETLADDSYAGGGRQTQRNEGRLRWTSRSLLRIQKLPPPAKQQTGTQTMAPRHLGNRRSSNLRFGNDLALLLHGP